MHPLCAIQVENSEDRRRVRLRRHSHQRQACHGAEIHRNDAGSLFESVVETFHHEYRVAGFDEIVHDAVTRFEMRLRESPPLDIHAIFSEGNPVAVFKKLLLDSGLVDECTVSAVEVLETVAFLRPDEFGMMSGHVLVGQNNIGIAPPSNQNFGSDQWKDVLLSI